MAHAVVRPSRLAPLAIVAALLTGCAGLSDVSAEDEAAAAHGTLDSYRAIAPSLEWGGACDLSPHSEQNAKECKLAFHIPGVDVRSEPARYYAVATRIHRARFTFPADGVRSVLPGVRAGDALVPVHWRCPPQDRRVSAGEFVFDPGDRDDLRVLTRAEAEPVIQDARRAGCRLVVDTERAVPVIAPTP